MWATATASAVANAVAVGGGSLYEQRTIAPPIATSSQLVESELGHRIGSTIVAWERTKVKKVSVSVSVHAH